MGHGRAGTLEPLTAGDGTELDRVLLGLATMQLDALHVSGDILSFVNRVLNRQVL